MINANIFPDGGVSKYGYVYPDELMDEVVAKFDGNMFGVFGGDNPKDLTQVAFTVESLSRTTGNVVATCKVLETPKGKILKALIESGVTYKYGIEGYGIVKGNTICDFVFTGVSVIA